MTRYIDADAVISGVKNRCIGQNDVVKVEHSIISMIYMMPTIDAVPVIRCKDCKYYPNGIRFCIDSYAHCSHMIDDGFCSWAVRKGEE